MKKLILLFSLAVLGFSCAKKDNNNNTTPVYVFQQNGTCLDQTNNVIVAQNLCSNAGYTYNVNGQCIQTSTGQIVTPTLCQTNTLNNGTYTYANGGCYVTATGQQVPVTYCQQSGGQQCYGPYIYPGDGRVYQCGTQYNCSGQTMTNAQTGQQVRCL